ncbi:broad-complex core protein isoforms 1/2/3/4/5-like [Anopheles aquasalis]|uniref:broad-complex core protein isoforms 1/2/3/4/5-like n=1 Tax=Anopheles aquasalis TaxID=42839 RepID=UPI00215A8B22|nr:broad-complex core protein isoforms 1/2/3/4/5-like [Anopheles aquasalis]
MTNMPSPQFSLRWNNYAQYIATAFGVLRYDEDFVDVTLCCDGRKIGANKMLLSACSPYFKDVFKENPCQHPVIIFKNVRYTDLMSIVEFMYQGEVNIAQDQLPSFLQTAEMLAVRGLTENLNDTKLQQIVTTSQPASTVPVPATPTGPSTSDGERYEQETHTLSDGKVVSTTPQTTQENQGQMQDKEKQQVTVEPYSEAAEQSDASMNIEMTEFIVVDEAMASSNGNNNAFMAESYQLVAENIEEKNEDEDMAQGNIEIEGSDMDMIRNSQSSSEEPSKSNLLPVSMDTMGLNNENERNKCSECRRSFCSASALKRHQQAKHSSIQTLFTCALCEARFKTKWSLSTHKSKYHRGQSATIIIRTSEQDSAGTAGTNDTDDGAGKSVGEDSSTIARKTGKRTASGGMVTPVTSQVIVDAGNS